MKLAGERWVSEKKNGFSVSASDRQDQQTKNQAYRALLLFDMGLYDATYDGGSNLGWESSNETRIQVHSYAHEIYRFESGLG